MWLNNEKIVDAAISEYQKSLLTSCPRYVVIDKLFCEAKLDAVLSDLQQPHYWQTQKHTYSSLYVDDAQWLEASDDQRFVQRDVWQGQAIGSRCAGSNIAQSFLSYLRSSEFMSLLSRIFNVRLTDVTVEDPEVNTNFFRLGSRDFVEQHADDSPGREVCMLLYLNKEWKSNMGGELAFIGSGDAPIHITPLYNRCVLFDPSSKGSEHWVQALKSESAGEFRYNVTSWYWSV